MVNLFQQSDQFVNDTRNEIALVDINLKRDTDTTVTVATPVVMVFRYFDRHNISQRREVRSFIINTADYQFSGVPVEPEQRDIIEQIEGITKAIYEVGAVNGEPVWKWENISKLSYKVHAKFIRNEAV